ncbi:MAG TPA: asparagine--tRNA ligase [Acholeplasmataceae bacterium]|jgi:asparaginyl-tRNA synthetase|nr:asparagine--tRNA ligase [Acholeplasmataceae bacterium]
MKTIINLKRKIEEVAGKQVNIKGWVRSNRAQKEFGFLQVNDGTTLNHIQIVYDDQLDNFKEIQKIGVGSSVDITGEVVLTPDRPQPFEIKASEVILICEAGEDYPIQPKRHSREFLREVAHLRPRTNLFNAVFRTRSVMAHAIHEFFQNQDFVYVHTPILTGNDGEGAGEMFTVTTLKEFKKNEDFAKDFFQRQVFLTVTGQLHAEAYAQAFRNVYTFGPTFRAENSNTPKHGSEFWMIEPEMAFTDLNQLMNVAEAMVKHLVQTLFNKLPDELELFDKFVEKGLKERLQVVLEKPFYRITHAEAIDILLEAKTKFEFAPKHGEDLRTEHEKYLTEVHFDAPVFVTNWPKDIKAFYMRQNDDGKTVRAMDLLVAKSGELIGGSQREERFDLLTKRMKELNMHSEAIEWYINLRKYGGTTSSGFGLGFERLIMFVTGVENIRDVIPFPRTPRNCDF